MEGKLPSQREQFAKFVRPLDGEQVKERVIAVAAIVGGLYAVISLVLAVLPDRGVERHPTPGDSSVPDSTVVKAFAVEFVTAYLTAKRGEEATLNTYVTAKDLQLPPVKSAFTNADVTYVKQRYAEADGLSLWTAVVSGIVNGDNTTNQTRSYYQVSITMLDGACRATDLPAQLAAPQPGVDVRLNYRNQLALDGPLARAATGFLTAYLTGGSDFSRYITADSTEHPIDPAPYLKVDAVEVKSDSNGDPNDSATADVHVTVIARTKNYTLTELHYPLAMRAVEGRWQVLHIAPNPAVQLDQSQPSDSTQTTTTTTVAPPTPTRG
ncbi:conjugal transfer protein [Mycolicibacterium sp. XJ870]